MKFENLRNPDVAEIRNVQVIRIGRHEGYLDSMIFASVLSNTHGQETGNPLISAESGMLLVKLV